MQWCGSSWRLDELVNADNAHHQLEQLVFTLINFANFFRRICHIFHHRYLCTVSQRDDLQINLSNEIIIHLFSFVCHYLYVSNSHISWLSLKVLNPSKALNPDELHPGILKELMVELGHLFQHSIGTDEIRKKLPLALSAHCFTRWTLN